MDDGRLAAEPQALRFPQPPGDASPRGLTPPPTHTHLQPRVHCQRLGQGSYTRLANIIVSQHQVGELHGSGER